LEDQIDFRIKWDDTTYLAGGFPIKIADVKMKAADPGVTTGPIVTSITQYETQAEGGLPMRVSGSG
jgi:hypothetical protein